MASPSGFSLCSTVPCTVLVKSGSASTEPGACSVGPDCVTRSVKLVSMRLKPTVWLLARLSDTCPRARACAERPEMAVVIEPKSDMPESLLVVPARGVVPGWFGVVPLVRVVGRIPSSIRRATPAGRSPGRACRAAA